MAETLRLPIEVTADGALRTLTQDTPAEIGQSVRTLLATTTGQRTAIPEYGLVNLLGLIDIDTADIAAALADWEPRVQDPQIITSLAIQLADGVPLHEITVII